MERQACDRCHGHKVRCTRTAPGGPCLRCQRAGATCVFSPPSSSSTRSHAHSHSHATQKPRQRKGRSRPRAQSQPTYEAEFPADAEQVAATAWLNTGLLTPLARDIDSTLQAFDLSSSPSLVGQPITSGPVSVDGRFDCSRNSSISSNHIPESTTPQLNVDRYPNNSNSNSNSYFFCADNHNDPPRFPVFSVPSECPPSWPPEETGTSITIPNHFIYHTSSSSSSSSSHLCPPGLEMNMNTPPQRRGSATSVSVSVIPPEPALEPEAEPEQEQEPPFLHTNQPPIESMDECMRSLFQLHLTLYQSAQHTAQIKTNHVIKSSQTLLVIIHSFYLNGLRHSASQPSSQPPPPGPKSSEKDKSCSEHNGNNVTRSATTAIPIISCYIQLLHLYIEFVRLLHRRTVDLPSTVQIGTNAHIGTSLLPPSPSELEGVLKEQLALHLLGRVSRSIRIYLSFCLGRGEGHSQSHPDVQVPGESGGGSSDSFSMAAPLEGLLGTLTEQEAVLSRVLERLAETTLQKGFSASRGID